jgi:hypothetical protein
MYAVVGQSRNCSTIDENGNAKLLIGFKHARYISQVSPKTSQEMISTERIEG